MSQKPQSDVQKHFAVGRGLLGAAETLNFSMNEQRQMESVRVGGGDGQDCPASMSQRGGSLGTTMKLFASLGLSAADLDALAQIPENEISVETLPRILRQLKSRKTDASEQRAPSMSDLGRRGGGDGWEEGRMGGTSSRSQHSTGFGFGSMQEVTSSRGYGLNYANSGPASRERAFSSLSQQESYGGLGVRPTPTDSLFMQRRIGSPSVGKVQDFLGVMPSMYPHVCSLCDFDVHSSMEWNQHTNGLRHTENRRLLLDMYPEWDPTMSPNRGGGFMEGNSRPTSLLGPVPSSSGGLGSTWGGGGGGPSLPGKVHGGSSPKRTPVVVVKYARKPLSNKTLFAFAEPFGVLTEHLVLQSKAFLEMRTPEEAEDMVNYYDQHPATLYGKTLVFYLSRRLTAIQKHGQPSMEEEMDRPMNRPADRFSRDFQGCNSKVVFFSNLPRAEEEKKELLTVCGRFGFVEKHLFLLDQAFVQLGTVKDAEMLVKYHTVNPLTIKGRSIRLNICAKYKTLNLKNKDSESGEDGHRRGRNSSSRGRTSSSARSKNREERRKKEEEEEKPAQEEEMILGGDKEKEDVQEAGGGAEEEEPNAELSLEEGEKKEDQDQSLTEEAVNEADSQAVLEAEPESLDALSNEMEGQDEINADAAESSATAADAFEQMDQDLMENMEDFVTLDELQEDEDREGDEDIDKTKKGGMRVVNILGLRRGPDVLTQLLDLAKPFGKVVRHLLLDLKPEAFLQFKTEAEARAMTKFYNGNVQALVCGRPVKVVHSMSYPIIQCGSSKVVYLSRIPVGNYSGESLLEFAKPYGTVSRYFYNRPKKECFIEMENPEEAEKMAAEFKFNPLMFKGKRLTVHVCRKYKTLKYGHYVPKKRSRSPPLKPSEEPETKKPREELRVEQEEEPRVEQEEEPRVEQEEEPRVEQGEEPRVEQEKPIKVEQKEELSVEQEELRVEQEEEPSVEQKKQIKVEESSADESIAQAEEKTSDVDYQQEERQEVKELEKQDGLTPPTSSAEINNSDETSLLPPYDPNTPVGVEHVKMGYYCRVCCLFYSNEEKAKKIHCSSKTHYNKLQKLLEKGKRV